MKRILLCYFIFISVPGFSQDDVYSSANMESQPVMANFKTYGYIGGIRLDSVDAKFAEFEVRFDEITFDYGQKWAKRKQLAVTDNKGTPLLLPTIQIAFILNFFYFNGWRPAQINRNPGEALYILEKN